MQEGVGSSRQRGTTTHRPLERRVGSAPRSRGRWSSACPVPVRVGVCACVYMCLVALRASSPHLQLSSVVVGAGLTGPLLLTGHGPLARPPTLLALPTVPLENGSEPPLTPIMGLLGEAVHRVP